MNGSKKPTGTRFNSNGETNNINTFCFRIVNNKLQNIILIESIIFLFAIFFILIYTLPDNSLILYPNLRIYVDLIAAVVPVVDNLRVHSEFPQAAAAVYALGISFWLALTVCFVYYLPFNKINIGNTRLQASIYFFFMLFLVSIFIYTFFIYFPGDNLEPTTRRGRLFSQMLNNRLT